MVRLVAALLLFFVPQYGVPSRTYVAASTAPTGACTFANPSGTSMSVSLTIAPNSVTVVVHGNSGANGNNISSLTDTLGNTWTYVGGNYAGTAGQAWYCTHCIGGADTITMGFSASNALTTGFGAVNYPLMTGTVSGQDTAATGARCTGCLTWSTGNYTTANATDYVLSQDFVSSSNTQMTPVTASGAGMTQDFSCSGNVGATGAQAITFASKLATSTATYNETYTFQSTANNTSQAGIFALKHS